MVPIFEGGEVIGEIDIDGSDLDAFDETDARFLEEVAALARPAATPGVTAARTASVRCPPVRVRSSRSTTSTSSASIGSSMPGSATTPMPRI